MAELSLDDLAMFVRVLDRGGFSSAARSLGVPTSNVSRAVARLESQSGVQLLHRTTRAVKATSEGQELFASVAPAMTTLRGAVRTIEPAARKPKGRLRVTAPNDLAATYLADIIVGFTATYPLVRLDFSLSNAHANLVDEGFDVAIRAAPRLSDSSLVARKLGEVELGLYAAPSYLKKHGAPGSKDDLARHACVVFRGEELSRTWPLMGPDGTPAPSCRGTSAATTSPSYARSSWREGASGCCRASTARRTWPEEDSCASCRSGTRAGRRCTCCTRRPGLCRRE